MNRIERERAVVARMILIYCRRHHGSGKGELCDECRDLLEYAHKHLDNCPKGKLKRSCRKCDIHCYAPVYKERIREVMRYVGPRMLFIAPVSAIRHLISELR